ncbi:ATP-binding protein [Lachnoclostridium sp. Marseille-P6806]|uniref:ATP-binding protein n=1 Tax=Lachnoclostridium sp. Marseille-P6806 TaxID=2364793 RepID=UPI001030D3B6|nr:ATP-binding protein [Lachnoclostridium sp. Marseille-P6806]
MYRKIYERLKEWKNSKYRKPLILQGPRQVGKTYSVLEFGRLEYEQVAYFNFQTDQKLLQTFEESLHPDYLIPLLSRIAKVTITKGQTLIVFDEVQLSERALTALKYFCEAAPEYHVIAAGSLLGVAVNREQFSFPVGKVDILDMYPMDFGEFLLAMREEELRKEIAEHYASDEPMPLVSHDAAMQMYREYLVVGGMPECVGKYAATKDFVLIRQTQDEILTGYMNDMSKYNKNTEIQKTRLVYNSIIVQLSRKNTRFQYKLVRKGGRASELENAIEWLVLSGIVSRIYCIDRAWKPLENYKNIDAFKIYMSDTGLLCAKQDVVPDDVLYMTSELDEFKGGMTENYVNCQLAANGYRSYCWSPDSNTEVDFVIQKAGKIIPLEVKAGENVGARSLKKYMDMYTPEYAIRLSAKNFGFDDGKKSVPLYATFCI